MRRATKASYYYYFHTLNQSVKAKALWEHLDPTHEWQLTVFDQVSHESLWRGEHWKTMELRYQGASEELRISYYLKRDGDNVRALVDASFGEARFGHHPRACGDIQHAEGTFTTCFHPSGDSLHEELVDWIVDHHPNHLEGILKRDHFKEVLVALEEASPHARAYREWGVSTREELRLRYLFDRDPVAFWGELPPLMRLGARLHYAAVRRGKTVNFNGLSAYFALTGVISALACVCYIVMGAWVPAAIYASGFYLQWVVFVKVGRMIKRKSSRTPSKI